MLHHTYRIRFERFYMHFTSVAPSTPHDLRAFGSCKARMYYALKNTDEKNLLGSANDLYVAGKCDEAVDTAQVVVDGYYNKAVAGPDGA